MSIEADCGASGTACASARGAPSPLPATRVCRVAGVCIPCVRYVVRAVSGARRRAVAANSMIALRFRKYIWLYSRVCIWLVFRVRIMITRVPCAVLSGVGTIGCGGFDSSDVPPAFLRTITSISITLIVLTASYRSLKRPVAYLPRAAPAGREA